MNKFAALLEEAKHAKIWEAEAYKKLEPELKRRRVKAQSFIAINLDTNEYVVGKTRGEVTKLFGERFGNSLGWITRVKF